jgi:isohexenylglutaconyl-CoA hydratase
MSSQTFAHIAVEKRDFALFLTLQSPRNRNAMSAEMIGELEVVIRQLSQHSARALVIQGSDGTFCAGGDINQFAIDAATEVPTSGIDPVVASNRRFGRLLEAIDAAPQVVIAAIEGPTFGGGCGLACASDIVITHANARFSLSETTLGVIPAQIAPFVVRRLGLRTARRLALTAQRFDGRDAYRFGLADELCEDSTALTAAVENTLKLIGNCAPDANAITKQLFARAQQTPIADLLDQASQQFADVLRNEGREGAAAFLEKRRPHWVPQPASNNDGAK